MKGTVKLTLKKSLIGHEKRIKDCIRGLGLRKVGSTSNLNMTPEVKGLINKVKHLIKVEG